jgi:hypothetical protein
VSFVVQSISIISPSLFIISTSVSSDQNAVGLPPVEIVILHSTTYLYPLENENTHTHTPSGRQIALHGVCFVVTSPDCLFLSKSVSSKTDTTFDSVSYAPSLWEVMTVSNHLDDIRGYHFIVLASSSAARFHLIELK